MLLATEREKRGNILALHRVSSLSCGEATAIAFRVSWVVRKIGLSTTTECQAMPFGSYGLGFPDEIISGQARKMANIYALHRGSAKANAFTSASLQRACGEDVLSLHKRAGGDRALRVHALWPAWAGHRRLQGCFLSLLPAEWGQSMEEPCRWRAYRPASRVTGSTVRLWNKNEWGGVIMNGQKLDSRGGAMAS